MRPVRLTTRLIAAATGTVVLAVSALGVGATLIVDHELRASLDGSLRQRASDVARLSASAPAVLTTPGALEGPGDGRSVIVEVIDRHGAIVARSLTLGAKLLPPLRATDRPRYADVDLGEQSLRLLVAPLPETGGQAAGGTLLVAATTADIDATAGHLRRLLLGCALLAAVIGAIAVALAARRQLGPLRQLAAAARLVERTQDSRATLPGADARDEIGELARTLNAMLGSLEAARTRERALLADASHELRTPITAIAGNVEHLARHGLDDELLADLKDDVERLRRLVADLLVLERHDMAPLVRAPLRLDVLVCELADEHEHVAVGVLDAATVYGDADALRRAVANVLENAEVHGPSAARVDVSLHTEGASALLEVRDQGAGVAAHDAQRALSRFWRAPEARARPGSGLGLAIVDATVAAHDGTLALEGPVVRLVLPLAPGHGTNAARRSRRRAGEAATAEAG